MEPCQRALRIIGNPEKYRYHGDSTAWAGGVEYRNRTKQRNYWSSFVTNHFSVGFLAALLCVLGELWHLHTSPKVRKQRFDFDKSRCDKCWGRVVGISRHQCPGFASGVIRICIGSMTLCLGRKRRVTTLPYSRSPEAKHGLLAQINTERSENGKTKHRQGNRGTKMTQLPVYGHRLAADSGFHQSCVEKPNINGLFPKGYVHSQTTDRQTATIQEIAMLSTTKRDFIKTLHPASLPTTQTHFKKWQQQ